MAVTGFTIWHNPRCSKSRQTLELLERNGVAPRVRRYLDDAPDADEIRAVMTALDLPAIAIMRTGEAAFATLGLSRDSDAQSLIAAMVAHPVLIERPVVIRDDGAARLGRPPERVLELV